MGLVNRIKTIGLVLITVLIFNPIFGQTIKPKAVRGKINPNYTPRPNPFSPTPTPVPKRSKPRKRLAGGISSIGAPERYVRKVLIDMPKETLFQFLRSDGIMGSLNGDLRRAATQQYYCDTNGFHDMIFRVDENENSYWRFNKAVRVFDKNGNLVRTIAKTPEEDRMLVDEDGNMCLYRSSLLPSTSRIYDPKGNLIESPDFKNVKRVELELSRFSHGVLYSTRNTGIIHKLPETGEKKIYLNVVVAQNPPQPVRFPLVIDGFGIGEIIKTDDLGNSYWRYRQGDESWPVQEISHVYKFDSKGNLLAGFDFLPQFINGKTQALYHWEFDTNSIRLVKWEKEKP